jgi:hypothetical protein
MAQRGRSARFAGILIAAALVLPDAARATESQTYVLVEGSTFQRGCFDPCACPISLEEPMAGTFSLVPRSDNGLFAEYELLDVRWKVEGAVYATPPGAEITGAGSYTVGGEFAVQQRMQAELQVADEPPAPFDSGWVAGGGGFPDQIDIEISKNGKFCFDTVMHVVAKAQPLPEPGACLQLLVGSIALLGIAARRGGCRSGDGLLVIRAGRSSAG